MKEEAKGREISSPTLRRAMRALGVTPQKVGFGEGTRWEWRLDGPKVLNFYEEAQG